MSKVKITIPQLKEYKQDSRKFTMITVYDYPMALLVDRSQAEMILVGDSLGMVVLGYEGTVPVELNDVIYHLKAVTRAARNTLVVGDMPFMSYNVCKEEAIRNAGRLMKEGGADCVKIEGGLKVVDTVRAVVDAGIPVVAHIGLTPQTASMLGGFKVQGKDPQAAKRLLEEAQMLEEAGACAIVLECVPAALASLITEKLTIPTIGVGAGVNCDGQNLNGYDIIGIFDKFVPKFVKKYASLAPVILDAFNNFAEEVANGKFPTDEHIFNMNEEILKKIY
ncbi:ketopantoate hydroxymethyltransferase [Desulfotomaculum arcticum]|uniref:3-methyl-2-oxobutanoate hydroxymethyltransferase n=1 Tax=Desulfotruncus arcticus DSM 17038 TaxID=1121424 RepID=A0A1I2P159_9FIRM|nr:3-methyl-2-oxobutanoate hydroxymethyltransferase [Desulfotruncus arcticus]SFG09804.1 ketopantoate hydroxymethyltransferase [Desulfotomaculum arcticum] [Desulfotruncus arcticus DSM 17038]